MEVALWILAGCSVVTVLKDLYLLWESRRLIS